MFIDSLFILILNFNKFIKTGKIPAFLMCWNTAKYVIVWTLFKTIAMLVIYVDFFFKNIGKVMNVTNGDKYVFFCFG